VEYTFPVEGVPQIVEFPVITGTGNGLTVTFFTVAEPA
jgi:hypothetical protein